METLNTIQIIIGLLITVSTSGLVGSIIGLRYSKVKEKARAKQETEQATGLELGNTKELIDIYKQALVDVKNLVQKSEETHSKKIEEYNQRLNEAMSTLNKYEERIQEQETIINTLTKSQLKLRLGMMNLKSRSSDKCSDCEFRDECKKYISNIKK